VISYTAYLNDAAPFDFLGMDFDYIHRESQGKHVEAFNENEATWKNAIMAASLFSAGRTCIKGKGSGGESEKVFPREPQ